MILDLMMIKVEVGQHQGLKVTIEHFMPYHHQWQSVLSCQNLKVLKIQDPTSLPSRLHHWLSAGPLYLLQ